MSNEQTAIERTQELLDERGVKHVGNGGMTKWTNEDGCVCRAYTRPGHLTIDVAIMDASPEQAISATLGPGTCRIDVLNTGDCAGYECSEYIMHCNRCGHEFGHVLYNEDGDVWMSEPPNYCPNCGRRIVEVD